MRPLQLKMKFGKLIEECGGLKEASQACEDLARRYSVPQLSRCCTPNTPDFAPIDIVMALEEYCGQNIVSAAMAEQRPSERSAVGDLMDEASEATEVVALLQRHVREARSDGRISPREAKAIIAQAEAAIEQLRDVIDAVNAVAEAGR
nr:phage regulatory CII family protein [uncultured Brevundimonas sp.]